MILFPAIDLKDGKCVRLVRGEMNSATVFDLEPAEQAAQFVKAGCEWLHLVDLNGAVEDFNSRFKVAAVEARLLRSHRS